MDIVQIIANDCGYYYDWSHVPGAPDNPDQIVAPTTTTSYTVTYTDGTTSCSDMVSVNVIQPTVTATASQSVICPGGTVQLNAVLSNVLPCTYTIDMFDSYGDGWNGGYLEVFINGVSIGTFSATGSGSSATFNASAGDNIEIVYTAGSWENENTYTIYDPLGNVIISDGPRPATGTVWSGTASCPTNYTYSWSPSTGLSNPNIQNPVVSGITSPTTYTVTATNPAGCTATSSVTINVSTVNAGPDVTICPGGSTTLNAVGTSGCGGTGSYSWSPTTGLSNANIANPVASPSSTTTYIVAFNDGCGCTIYDTVTVNVSNFPPPVMSSTNESCQGLNDGTATATPSGGTPPYSYSWSPGGQTTQTITNLAPGTYTVTVTDATGCSSSNSVTINAGPLITAGFTYNGNQCLTGNNFTFTNTGTSGVSYYWNFGDGVGTSTLENPSYSYSSSGTYTVTQIVSNGTCSDTTTLSVIVFDEPIVALTGTNISCNGDSDGTATANVIGGTSPYTYSWSTGGTGASETGLPAGTYSVTVTDFNGCTATSFINLTEPPPLTATSDSTDVTCFGYSDGTATVYPSGGTPSYSYSWNTVPVQTTQTATNLSAGTYTATITDLNGCTLNVSVTVNQPPGMTLTTSSTDANCSANDGSASVSVTGGTPGYTYQWDDPALQTTDTAVNLVAGTYNVTVTDANGCSQTATVVVNSTGSISATANVDNNVSCFGGNDGQATVSVTGGTLPYTYSWSSGGTAATESGLSAGNYTVTVTDANGCIASTSVTITEPTQLTASISSKTNVSCAGGNDGTATVSASGGTPPYTYSWSSGGTAATETGLSAGTYSVTVTDANSCIASTTVTITEPTPITSSIITTDVSCNGGSDGAIDLTVSGGFAPYTYLWNNGSTAEDPVGLTAGTYIVTITDQNGCTHNDTAIINEAPLLIVNISSTTNVSCAGGNDGSATVNVSGGTSPYSYSWSSGGTVATETGLSAGTYSVTVTDANSCTASTTVTITEPTPISLSVTGTNDYCNLGNGTATVSASGGTPGYTYS